MSRSSMKVTDNNPVQPAGKVVPLWRVTEIVLESRVDRGNPYAEVCINGEWLDAGKVAVNTHVNEWAVRRD